jgi:hypothetical protein
MSITANSGPFGAFLDPNNPESAPSFFIEGTALLDPRPFYTYDPGQNFGALTAVFATTQIQTLNITPATKSAVSVAAAANTVNGTAITLVSSSGLGIVAGASVVNPLTGATVTGLLAVGQAAARVSFGQAATVQAWDPTTLTARALIVTCNNALGVGGNIVISGYDIYGFPMHETLAIVPGSAVTVTGKKAWKYIASATPNFTDATYTYSIGTTDVFGLPLASLQWADLVVFDANALITANTGYVAAVNTTATGSTGDVRGTYLLQTASNGTNPLVVTQTPVLAALALPNGVGGSSSGLFGVSQF